MLSCRRVLEGKCEFGKAKKNIRRVFKMFVENAQAVSAFQKVLFASKQIFTSQFSFPVNFLEYPHSSRKAFGAQDGSRVAQDILEEGPGQGRGLMAGLEGNHYRFLTREQCGESSFKISGLCLGKWKQLVRKLKTPCKDVTGRASLWVGMDSC